VVEHFIGNEEVGSSILLVGSINIKSHPVMGIFCALLLIFLTNVSL
jgi:hypothetical protein